MLGSGVALASGTIVAGMLVGHAVLGTDRYLGLAEILHPLFTARFSQVVRPAEAVPGIAGFFWKIRGVDAQTVEMLYPLEAVRDLFTQHSWAGPVHIFASGAAFFAGMANLSLRLPRRTHKTLGLVYLGAGTVGLLAGAWLGRHDVLAGKAGAVFFQCMAGFPLVAAYVGYASLLLGDAQGHAEWMIRSYAMMWSSVVVFRAGIYYVLPWFTAQAALASHPDWVASGNAVALKADSARRFPDVYNVLNVLSWAGALLAADVYISYKRLSNQFKKKK